MSRSFSGRSAACAWNSPPCWTNASPYVLCIRRAKDSSPEVRQVGAGLLLAGGTACAYHATHPDKQSKLRSVLRKLDYWTVSLATAALVRAAGPRVHT